MNQILSRITYSACAAALSLTVFAGYAQAAVVFSSDFESGIPAGISGAGVIAGTQGFSSFGFGNSYLRNDTVGPIVPTLLTLNGLGSHTDIQLTFHLAIIDSWDGNGGSPGPDLFEVSVNGTSVFAEVFAIASGSTSFSGTPLNAPGNYASYSSGWNDNAYAISLTLPHTSSNLQVEWKAVGAGWQGGSDESWAIDNIQVTTRDSNSPTNNVPEGGSALLMMALSTFCIAGMRRALAK